MFTGRGISENLPTDRVFVSDPTLYMNESLRLAWFAGNHKQYLLQRVIANILRSLVGDSKRVVTFGPSGGGFAALYFATVLPRATAVPVNPQTSIAADNASSAGAYARHGWNLVGPGAVARIPAVTDLTDLYSRPVKNRVWYIQNAGDKTHIDRHYSPFVEILHSTNKVSSILIDGPPGHVPPPKRSVRWILSAAVRGHARPPKIQDSTVNYSTVNYK